MSNVTKKLIERCVRDYIIRGLCPTNQPEPRPKDFFDIKGITNEFYARLIRYPRDFTEDEVMIIVRKIMRLAERNANMFKRGKIIELDIASAFDSIKEF